MTDRDETLAVAETVETPGGWPWRPLALLFLVALALRLLFAGFGGAITWDGVHFYLAAAQGFLDGDLERAMPPYHHPLFPLMIAFFQLLGFEPEWAGRSVSVLTGSLAVVPFFAIGRHLAGPRGGWIAAFLITFLPQHLKFSGWIQAEPLYILMLAWAVERALAYVGEGKGRDALLCGLFVGLAALTKGEGIMLGLLLPAMMAIRRQFRLAPVLGAGIVVLLVLPCVIKFSGDLGRLTYTPWSVNSFVLGEIDSRDRFDCFFEIAPGGEELLFYYRVTQDGYDPGLVKRTVLADPGGFAGRYFKRVQRFFLRFAPKAIPWPWLILMGLGMVIHARTRPPKGWILLVLIGAYAPIFPIYFVQDRFWITLTPTTFSWIALGSIFVLDRLEGRRGLLVVGLLLAGGGLFGLKELQWSEGWHGEKTRQASRELVAATGIEPGAYVLANRPALLYYAQTRTRRCELPVASWAEALAYARKHGADAFLVETSDVDRRGWREAMLAAGAREVEVNLAGGALQFLYLPLTS